MLKWFKPCLHAGVSLLFFFFLPRYLLLSQSNINQVLAQFVFSIESSVVYGGVESLLDNSKGDLKRQNEKSGIYWSSLMVRGLYVNILLASPKEKL